MALQQFVTGLKSRNPDVRRKTARELAVFVKSELRETTQEEINTFLNDFNHHIFEMVSNSDVNEKKGGILAIRCLITADVENMTVRISRFANYLRNLLPSHDVEVMELTAKTIGKLAFMSGSKASEYVEFEVKRAFEWLTIDRVEGKRHAAVLVLRELALMMPTYFYQQVCPFFDLIFNSLRDPKSKIREAAADALRAALIVTAQRESATQTTKPHWYKLCYYEAIDLLNVERNQTKDDCIHGALLVLNELLRCSNSVWEDKYNALQKTADMKHAIEEYFHTVNMQPCFKTLSTSDLPSFQNSSTNCVQTKKNESSVCRQLVIEKYDYICVNVTAQSSSRSVYIQNMLLNILPRLAAFDREQFSEKYLSITINYLLNTLKGREKERSTAFITVGLIAVTMEDLIKPFVPKIVEAVKLALPSREITLKKRVPINAGVFKCIIFLAYAVKEYIEIDIQNISDKMFSSDLTTPLTVCLRELAKNIPKLKQPISFGLLQMLSQILINKPLHHPGMPKYLALNMPPFSSFSDPNDAASIALALRTLGTFNFHVDSLLQFVQPCVDVFIVHEEQEIRVEAVRTCCKLLKHSVHKTAKRTSETVTQTVARVLRKLLTVAVTDTHSEVRFWVLFSLDSTFDKHLAQPESLSTLSIALNDEVFEIRQVAMCIMGRLSTRNPAYVMPTLRKILIQLLTQLEHATTGRHKEQSAGMLNRLIINAPCVIRSYMKQILKVLVPKLLEQEPNPGVVLSLLYCIGSVAEATRSEEMLPWMPKLLTFILEMLGDASSPEKRGVALFTLGQLVSFTGHLCKPYIEHPTLLPVLLNFLKTEQHPVIRRETIRVLGLLGAVDLHNQVIINGLTDSQPEAPVLIAIIDKEENFNAGYSTSEMLVNMGSSTLEEYYPTIAIATLMRIIQDPTLSQHHAMVVQAVTFIFKSLGSLCVPHISQVLPTFINVIRTADDNFRKFLFQQLAHLITNIQQHVCCYLDSIIDLIIHFWTPHSPIQITLIILVEHIAVALGTEFKSHLRRLIPNILNVLNYDASQNQHVIIKLLEALKKLGNNLDDYMYSLLFPILKLFDTQDCQIAVSKQALKTIDYLANILDLSELVLPIVHSLARTLDAHPELRSTAMETLCALIIQLGRKFIIFVPLVTKVTQKHKIEHARYEMLISIILDATLTDDIGHFLSELKVEHHDRDFTMSVNYTTVIQRLKVSPPDLQRAWTPARRVSKDDWLEWLQRLSIEFLKQSPIPALRSCLSLAQNYSQLSKDLFNVAFVSCWTELDITMQEELTNSLEQALMVPDLPEITQTILNLATFMERCGKGPLPLDPQLLGERAMYCRAYAKALHYKEEEFQQDSSSEVIEALIYINNKLQQKEAAEGLLQHFMQGSDDIQVQVHWYEKLHNWDKALSLYEESVVVDEETCLGQMRCLEALGEWHSLRNVVEVNFMGLSDNNKQKAATLAAASAWSLHDWESMERYVGVIPQDSQDGAFYRAILAIHKEQYDEAHRYIDMTRDLLDTGLTTMVGESYQRAYSAMVLVQMLAEMEEVIQYKLVPERRSALRIMWWQRLQAGQRCAEDWQRIIQVHSLVLNPEEDMHTLLKYASLCRKNGSLMLSQKTLVMLLGYDPTLNPEQHLPCIQPQVTFAYTKHLWMSGKKLEAYGRLTNFLQDYTEQININSDKSVEYDGQRLLARCYVKLGEWKESLQGVNKLSIPLILQCFEQATEHDPRWYKAWHSWAYMNFEAVRFYKNEDAVEDLVQNVKDDEMNNIIHYSVLAIQGFFKSINLSKGSSLQDTLRVLKLWFEHGQYSAVYDAIVEGIELIEKNTWLQVIPQLIARIDISRARVSGLIHDLLIHIGKSYPQALIYPLSVASKSTSTLRRNAANKILKSMSEHSPTLVNQALTVSEELVRVAVLWHEMWHEGLEEACRLFYTKHDVRGMFNVLESLHAIMERGWETVMEKEFTETYGGVLAKAKDKCQRFKESGDLLDLHSAWRLYYKVFLGISKKLPQLTSLELQSVSPKLLDCRDLELAVPGSYCPSRPIVRIAYIQSSLQVIASKQRPRNLLIRGSNGKDYMFLLKGHEDLRQDERVMQLFGLINTLLLKDPDTFRRNLAIQRYAVIPLSTNTGLIGWVPHCDTLHTLIKEYREKRKIPLNTEHRHMLRKAPDYDYLMLIQKLEVFETALQHTHGDDLAKLLWLKSPSSEVWFDRRTNYTRSLAVMSMVGYILGLGDRHPSNIMLNRLTGKILHIDFGDCFEVAINRKRFPEKIPFRLTRMLVNAMEVTGIEGTYRKTCESVMTVLHHNKDSLMAVLEAFIYDPLLNWRLIDAGRNNRSNNNDVGSLTYDQELGWSSLNISNRGLLSTETICNGTDTEADSKKALAILTRVRAKLTGRDFPHEKNVSIERQVELLIQQATSNENLCRCYVGWCPFW